MPKRSPLAENQAQITWSLAQEKRMSPSLVYLGIRVRYCGLGLISLDECEAHFIWVKERSCKQTVSWFYKLSIFIYYVRAPAVILVSYLRVYSYRKGSLSRM